MKQRGDGKHLAKGYLNNVLSLSAILILLRLLEDY